MTECEALDKILGECPGLSVRADVVDVFAELINAMNLAYFIAKSLDCWNALFPVMFAQAFPKNYRTKIVRIIFKNYDATELALKLKTNPILSPCKQQERDRIGDWDIVNSLVTRFSAFYNRSHH